MQIILGRETVSANLFLGRTWTIPPEAMLINLITPTASFSFLPLFKLTAAHLVIMSSDLIIIIIPFPSLSPAVILTPNPGVNVRGLQGIPVEGPLITGPQYFLNAPGMAS